MHQIYSQNILIIANAFGRYMTSTCLLAQWDKSWTDKLATEFVSGCLSGLGFSQPSNRKGRLQAHFNFGTSYERRSPPFLLLPYPFLVRNKYSFTLGLTERVIQSADGQARVRSHYILATFCTKLESLRLEAELF